MSGEKICWTIYFVCTVDNCNPLIIIAVVVDVSLPSSPTNLSSPSQSPTSITLSWEQQAGDVVDRYDIVYTYQGGCSDYTQPENMHMATVNDGTAREYTLQNLQEFSDYNITIAAVIDAGLSMQTKLTATTQSARMYIEVVSAVIASIICIAFQLPVVLLSL